MTCLIFVKLLKKRDKTMKFIDAEKRIERFKKTIFSISTDNDDDENNYSSFVNTIFFPIRFHLDQKTTLCSIAELKESIDSNLFIQLNQENFNIVLDYQNFNNRCHEVNMLLPKHGYF